MYTPPEIDKIVARIVEVYQPESVILFGSYVTGEAGKDSDLDLLLVKQTNEPQSDRSAKVRKALRDFMLPMDILVYTPAEIEKDRNRKFTFIHDVLRSGKILYGRL